MPVNIAKTKCKVIHFRKHSGFVRDINIAIIVVDQNIPACSCRGLEIDEACPVRSQNFGQQDLCIDFDEMIATAVDIENVCEALFVKIEKSPHLVTGLSTGANRKPVRTYWPQKHRMK